MKDSITGEAVSLHWFWDDSVQPVTQPQTGASKETATALPPDYVSAATAAAERRVAIFCARRWDRSSMVVE